MKIQKVLTITVVVLFVTLMAQIGVSYFNKPNEVHLFAAWKDNPKSVEEATALADEVVHGQVIKIRRGEDLVIKIEGETNAEDRIPVEVITFKVEKNYKGKASTMEIFHVGGLATPLSKGPPPMSEAPPKPKDGVDRSQAAKRPNENDLRQFSLDDDPPYKVGEKYLLFVRKGPQVKVDGKDTQTNAIVSPTTRFRIGANNLLEAVTNNGFAPTFKGKNLREIEAKLPKQ